MSHLAPTPTPKSNEDYMYMQTICIPSDHEEKDVQKLKKKIKKSVLHCMRSCAQKVPTVYTFL